MAEVICNTEVLAKNRRESITSLLAQVSDVPPLVIPKVKGSEFVLVASYGKQPTANEREWSFPSTVGSIECRYIELWTPADITGKSWMLRHVYFHLIWYCGRERDPKEMFAFHWEPSRLIEDAQGEHLQRPHVHLSIAPQPLARSHFVVTLTVAAEEQSNVEYLDHLLDEAMRLVKTEVLDRFDTKSLAWGQLAEAGAE